MNGSPTEGSGPYARPGNGGRDPATALLNMPFHDRAGLWGEFKARRRVLGSGAWEQQPALAQSHMGQQWAGPFGSTSYGEGKGASGTSTRLDDQVYGRPAFGVPPAGPAQSHREVPPDVSFAGPKARKTAPGVRPYTWGSASTSSVIEASVGEFEAAETAFQEAKLANSSRGAAASRLKWWELKTQAKGIDPYPLDVSKLRYAGILLHAAGYRSAALYMSAFKQEHIRRSYPWSQQLSLEITEAGRAFKRGKGPDRQSGCIDLDKAIVQGALDIEWPGSAKGPIQPF